MITLLCIRYLCIWKRFARISSHVKNPIPPIIIKMCIRDRARTVLEWNQRIPENIKKEISWDRRYPMEHQIHRYSEIEFYEMMNKMKEPEKLADFIHPALYRLNKYDQDVYKRQVITWRVQPHTSYTPEATSYSANALLSEK